MTAADVKNGVVAGESSLEDVHTPTKPDLKVEDAGTSNGGVHDAKTTDSNEAKNSSEVNTEAAAEATSESLVSERKSDTILPSLRGHLTRQDNSVTWVGEWGMDDSAFCEGGVLSPFSYTRVSVADDQSSNNLNKDVHLLPGESSESDTLENAYFSGSFSIMLGGRGKEVHEDNVLFEFATDESLPNGQIRVLGSGTNQFGPYSLRGTLDLPTGRLNLLREYKPAARKATTPKVPTTVKKRPARAASAKQKTPVSVSTPAPASTAKESNTRNQRVRRTPSHLVYDALDEETADAMLKLKNIVRDVMRTDRDGWFCAPVDAEALGLRNYHRIISRPMDLGTVIKRIETREYYNNEDVIEDVRLTFANAIKFNPPANGVHIAAKRYLAMFESQLKKNSLLKHLKKRKIESGKSGDKKGKKSRSGGSKNAFDSEDDLGYSSSDDDFKGKKGKGKGSPKRKSSSSNRRVSSKAAAEEVRGLQEQIQMMSKQIEMMSRLQKASLASQMQQIQEGQPFSQAGFSSAAPSKPNGSGSQVVSGPRELSFQEKRQLGLDIRKLPSEMLDGIIKIITDSGAELQTDEDGDVEIDIDGLETPALRKMQKYVKRSLSRVRAEV